MLQLHVRPNRVLSLCILLGIVFVVSGGGGPHQVGARGLRPALLQPQAGQFTLVGKYPTPASRVHVQDNLAYLVGEQVEFIDVTVPTSPTLLTHFDLHDNHAQNLQVAGAYGYMPVVVPGGERGFQIADLHDPRTPRVVGGMPLGGMVAYTVANGFVYMAEYEAVVVIDAQTPGFPRQRARLPLSKIRYASDIRVVGTLVYVVGSGGIIGYLEIVDVSNPDEPVIRSALALDSPEPYLPDGSPIQVALDDGVAYISVGFSRNGSGIYTVNVRDPDRPSMIEQYYAGGRSYHVEVVGDLLYVNASDRLRVFDVRVPAHQCRMHTATCSQTSWIWRWWTSACTA